MQTEDLGHMSRHQVRGREEVRLSEPSTSPDRSSERGLTASLP